MPEIAGKSVSTNDTAVLGAGALFLLFSFFPYYGASVSIGGHSASQSTSAWHGIEVLAILLMAAAVALVAVRVFGNMPELPVGPRLVVLALTALSALITVIRVLTLDRGNSFGVSYGPKFGAWLMIITALAATVFAFLAFRESGEKMPTAGGTGTAGGDMAPPPPPSV